MNQELTPGSTAYTPSTLSIYDLFVLGFSNRFIWRCPTSEIVELYNRNVSARHLDIGVGTGYFLDHCRFPTGKPTIALVDLNPNSLEHTARRIARYAPRTYRANVLEPFQVDLAPFDSVGLNYLLHCLPGDLEGKAALFERIRPMLAPGGVVFGATILSSGVPENLPARLLMRAYNARGIFGNERDSLEALEAALARNFSRHSIVVRGCAALFTARA